MAQPQSVDSSSPNVEIIISSEPKSIQNFVFSSELGNFSLDNPEKEDKDGVTQSQKFSVAADVYTVSQAKLTLWELSDITCEGNQDAVQIDLGKRSVTITASTDEKITCTFHNKRLVNLEALSSTMLMAMGCAKLLSLIWRTGKLPSTTAKAMQLLQI